MYAEDQSFDQPDYPQEEKGHDIYQPTTSADALRFRINTQPLIEEIRRILKGEELTIDNGIVQVRKFGKPLLNSEGVGKILSIVKSHINSHTVQGNLDTDQLNMIIKNLKQKLALSLASNGRDWQSQDSDRRVVVMNIEQPVFIFLSRCLENKERESYGMKTVHQSQIMPQQRGWGFFGKRGNPE
jgi:hypothetical protein|tara:strand:+ start:683 stop:1237 length:555 start_codon:yes stop_codon:yes gene_type:complete